MTLQSDFFKPIDRIFATFLSKDPDAQLFLATLMATSRMGHLCMRVEEERILPSIVPKEVEARAASAASHLDPKLFEGPLVREANRYYLKRNHFFETRLKEGVARLTENRESLPVTYAEGLNEGQAAALQKAMESPFFVLTGGPGCGKTYAAAAIVGSFKKARPDGRVLAAAPTGKAAARLGESLGTQAQTLHALLGVRSPKDTFKEPHPIEADLILVDEASMIDVRLFALLLSAVKPTTRLILMGDADQLPPVEAGTVFAQLVQMIRAMKPHLTAHLSQCMRSDQQMILSLARAIKECDHKTVDGALHHLHLKPLDYGIVSWLDRQYDQPELTDLKKLGVLSTLKKGPFGSEELSQKIFRKKCQNLHKPTLLHIPIMITRTDLNLGLYNGEMGILKRHIANIDDPLTLEDQAYFEGDRTLPALILPPFEIAYVISVHKSQGSEFDRVIFLIPDRSDAFSREILYTGVTRAKKELMLRGDRALIQQMLTVQAYRHSGI